MMHGIDFKKEYTLKEVGFHLKVSPERVRQIHKKALSIMSHTKNLEKLKEAGIKDVYNISENKKLNSLYETE